MEDTERVLLTSPFSTLKRKNNNFIVKIQYHIHKKQVMYVSYFSEVLIMAIPTAIVYNNGCMNTDIHRSDSDSYNHGEKVDETRILFQ